jgi:hypothetical protein
LNYFISPNKYINQMPVVISGRHHTNANRNIVTKHGSGFVHVKHSAETQKEVNMTSTPTASMVIGKVGPLAMSPYTAPQTTISYGSGIEAGLARLNFNPKKRGAPKNIKLKA